MKITFLTVSMSPISKISTVETMMAQAICPKDGYQPALLRG